MKGTLLQALREPALMSKKMLAIPANDTLMADTGAWIRKIHHKTRFTRF